MKERAILFSGEMVRALLAGRKTQTRRVCKGFTQPGVVAEMCPYGVPGDRLWVRETWARRLDEDHLSAAQLSGKWAWYWADPQTCNTGCAGAAGKKRVSIHMPRWASRLTLEITEIRVERVQDINEADAKAEGVELIKTPEGPWPKNIVQMYHLLWDSLNAKRGYGWDVNTFVWVIGFKKVTNG